MSIFNVSTEEAKRIRILHETESKNKKIDSTILSEAPVTDRCGGNYPCHGPSGRRVSWQACPGYSGPNLLNPLPCAMIDGQTPNSSHVGKYVGMEDIGSGWCAKITSIGPHTLPGTTTSCPPTGLKLGTDCDNCYTTGNGGTITYNCNNGNCIGINGNSGQFATLSDCEDDCADPIRYSCSNGSCIQDPNGQYATLSDCQDNCEPLPSITYNCGIQGSCVPVQGAGGQYMTMADCTEECRYEGKWTCKERNTGTIGEQYGGQAGINPVLTSTGGLHCVKDLNGQYNTKQQCEDKCGGRGEPKRNYCVNCEKQVMSYYPGMPSGSQTSCPQGFVDIGLDPSPMPGPCVECLNNNCQQGQGWVGPFNSMSDCQNSPQCSGGGGAHECVNGQCVQQNGGQFIDAAACQASGCGTQLMWECDNGPNGCTQTQTGTFQSQAQCETACCVDFVNGYGWATNHPNATSAQACNRIYNQFGQLGSFNPNTLPFYDGCEYDYLINIAGVCGVNPNYQNLITGFIGGNNGCYGNPNAQNQGYGQGNPHQNSVCGKVEQFCLAPVGNNTPPSTPTEWYKCQWTQQEAINGGCFC